VLKAVVEPHTLSEAVCIGSELSRTEVSPLLNDRTVGLLHVAIRVGDLDAMKHIDNGFPRCKDEPIGQLFHRCF
jgi:hypothetical protein